MRPEDEQRMRMLLNMMKQNQAGAPPQERAPVAPTAPYPGPQTTYDFPTTQRKQQGGGMPSMPPGLMDKFLGSGAGATEGSFGGAGMGGELGTAGSGATGGSAAGSGTSSLGSLGPIGAIIAAVGLTKGREARSSGTENKLWRTFNAPSGAQLKKDPKLAAMWGTGMGWLAPWIGMGKKGAQEKPEWEKVIGL